MKIHYGIIIIMCCLLNACQPASQNPRIYDSGISQELAELRKQEINELKYDLRLSIPKQKSMPVEGEIHVRFRLNKAQEVILDFREEADKIKEVSANGLPTSYEFRNEHIILPKNTPRPTLKSWKATSKRTAPTLICCLAVCWIGDCRCPCRIGLRKSITALSIPTHPAMLH